MPSRFSIKIEAEDQGIPKLNSSAVIEVNLEDIDDLNPIFSSSIYKAKKSNFVRFFNFRGNPEDHH